MKLIKIKEIPEINKKYYKVMKLVCDECDKEIKEKELYLEVNYHKEKYEELSYMHFCKDCMKESMYKMFMGNYYTNFDKCYFSKCDEWEEYDEWDRERFGYKVGE